MVGKSLHTAIRLGVNNNETDKGRLMQLHDLNLEPDGSVDLTINLNVNELIRLVKAYTDGSFNGEMTENRLPPKIAFLVPNAGVCEKAPGMQVLIYVHSAPSHTHQRALLRSTWANPHLFRDRRTQVVFLLGRPSTTLEMDKLLGEHDVHRDLVIGDFDDVYHNLTLKAIMGLKWVTAFCPDAKYVIKADDDAFVNIFEVLKLIKTSVGRIIACPLWKENTMPIMRDPAKCKKWCVHFYEFPGRTHFPQYCAGLTAIFSAPIIREMYQASHKTPMFWIDDVYLTGVLAHKVPNIRYINLGANFTLKEDLSFEDYTVKSNKPFTYLIMQVKNRDKFSAMWSASLRRLQSNELKELGRQVLTPYPSLKKFV